MKPTKKDKDFDKLRKPIKVCQKKKEKMKTNQRKQIDWFKWSERESHTVAVNTRKVVNKKSMAFKAIFRKRREENVNATSHLILIQGNTICGINRAQNGERNLYSWPFIQSNSACQLELHQITETQVMATCPETQFLFFSFFFLGRNWCPEVWLN